MRYVAPAKKCIMMRARPDGLRRSIAICIPTSDRKRKLKTWENKINLLIVTRKEKKCYKRNARRATKHGIVILRTVNAVSKREHPI